MDRFKHRVFDKKANKYVENWNANELLMIGGDGVLYIVDHGIMLEEKEGAIVEQCTGVKDKNGKLIYEGDIVKDNLMTYTVKYKYSGFVISIDNLSSPLAAANILLEVIGNIHENPELLES